MKRRGRANLLMIVGLVGLVIMVVLFLVFGGRTPQATADRFMVALAKGDVAALTELSHMPGKTPEQIREEWEFTTRIGKHYRFIWKFTGTAQPNEEQATARMQVHRDFPFQYDENFEVPLRRIDGKWKVDVRAINRGLYPALPR